MRETVVRRSLPRFAALREDVSVRRAVLHATQYEGKDRLPHGGTVSPPESLCYHSVLARSEITRA